MRGFQRTMALTVLAIGLACAPKAAQAEHPTYLILPASPPVGYALPTDRPRYAYGWFGASRHAKWRRHFGFYRNYTQWTAR